ncbi:TetR/AcrR family transcriptional regulator [Sphingobium sp. AN558]|uniref:TetR/AcrR family transcriptional regulator n=1 Tax=Sphingobium sp. AN558 TaxID=3133442 RepID=UPI0030C34623
MVRSAEAVSRREQRAERRQLQILDAARACVRVEGIHGASMSRIATEAGMSVGHIYQYFENKEAIMLALCERDFDDFMLHINHIGEDAGADTDTIVKTFAHEIIWLLDNDRAALTLEVMAEAARNPRFSDLVLGVDHRLRSALHNIIEPVLKGHAQSDIDMRIETLLVMTRCLTVHAATRPIADRRVLASGFELAFRGLISPS